jgi:hypothetical protein
VGVWCDGLRVFEVLTGLVEGVVVEYVSTFHRTREHRDHDQGSTAFPQWGLRGGNWRSDATSLDDDT